MSQAQLLELEKIQETLLASLSVQELKDFVFDLIQKASQKKAKQKDVLPANIRQGIAQSLKEHKEGLGVVLETDEEIENYFLNLKKENV